MRPTSEVMAASNWSSRLSIVGVGRNASSSPTLSRPMSANDDGGGARCTKAAPYLQPGTLRTAVFLAGAVLGWAGKEMVVRLSAAWGGRKKHKPLTESVLGSMNPTPPKLTPLETPPPC